MQVLVKLYEKTLIWAKHRHAPRYLAAVCFVEASVFPIPPYFMLAPMALSKPDKAANYAIIATIFSVAGGILGYFLGALVFYPIVLPIIEYFGYEHYYNAITARFQENGFLAVLLSGFMPMPFKVVAIAAGFMQVPLALFVLASIFGRGAKFFAVAMLIRLGGDKMEQQIKQIISKVGIIFVILAALILGLKLFKVF